MAATSATRRAAMVAIAEGYSPEDAGCQLVAGWGWPSTSTRSNSVQAQFGQLNLANIGSFEASWVVGHVTRLSTFPHCSHFLATAMSCLPSSESTRPPSSLSACEGDGAWARGVTAA